MTSGRESTFGICTYSRTGDLENVKDTGRKMHVQIVRASTEVLRANVQAIVQGKLKSTERSAIYHWLHDFGVFNPRGLEPGRDLVALHQFWHWIQYQKAVYPKSQIVEITIDRYQR